jgi:CheY-like chemotaxis protein
MEKTNVLVVEDGFVVAMDLHRNLEQLGYAVCCSSSEFVSLQKT